MNRVSRKWWYIITQIIYKRKFNRIGKGTVIYRPLQFNRVYTVTIEKNVFLAEGVWLIGSDKESDTMTIMEGTVIGHYAHIVARHSVIIEKHVLIADKVFITDSSHEFEDVTLPIKNQGMRIDGDVVIGENSWVGENVAICGASIGKNCVIGANSVVTHDIPDYCVAVGNPAKVIKRFDFENGKWMKV